MKKRGWEEKEPSASRPKFLQLSAEPDCDCTNWATAGTCITHNKQNVPDRPANQDFIGIREQARPVVMKILDYDGQNPGCSVRGTRKKNFLWRSHAFP